MKSVGAQLREARQARGWTPKAAAKATKIKEQQLLQLENEEYAKFAAPAYVRGFVRIYAKTLGLNEAKILQELDQVLAAEGDDVYLSSSPVQYMPQEDRKPLSFRSLAFLLLVGVVAAVVVILVVRVYTVLPGRHEATAKAVAAAPADKIPTANAVPLPPADEPVPAKAVAVNPPEEVAKAIPVARAVAVTPPPAPAPAAPAEEPVAKAEPVARATAVVPTPAAPAEATRLTLRAREDCWVRVTVLDGGQPHELFAEILRRGEERSFPGEKFVLKIANPSVMEVSYNGRGVALGEVKVPTEYPLP